MIADMPARLIVAYALMALMILTAAGFAWWRFHYAPHRMQARERARRRAAQALLDE